jgi:hypothetical protein
MRNFTNESKISRHFSFKLILLVPPGIDEQAETVREHSVQPGKLRHPRHGIRTGMQKCQQAVQRIGRHLIILKQEAAGIWVMNDVIALSMHPFCLPPPLPPFKSLIIFLKIAGLPFHKLPGQVVIANKRRPQDADLQPPSTRREGR